MGIILRFYESAGSRGRATVRLGLRDLNNLMQESCVYHWSTPRVNAVQILDADEREPKTGDSECAVHIPGTIDNNSSHFTITYCPYKIITVKVMLAFVTNKKRARELKV